MKIKIYVILLILLTSLLWADEISNFQFEQRTDGSLIVDIYYDLAYEDYAQYAKIVVEASDDNGETWDLECSSMTGDIDSVTAGDDKQIVWDFYTDNPNVSGDDYKIKLTCYLYSTMTGNDGTVYTTIKIGDQWWMAENLRETKYSDDTDIPEVKDFTDWKNTYSFNKECARCVYDNNEEDNAIIYGYLYNGYAATNSLLPPSGWHVPTDDDFKELEMYLGMSEDAANSTGSRGTNEGSKLAGQKSLWGDKITENDEFGISGFFGLPAGYRHLGLNYSGVNSYLYLWTSTNNIDRLYYRYLNRLNTKVMRTYFNKGNGLSIRLVKDSE